MVSSIFEQLLKEFESFFNCTLKPDANNSCLINMENMGITVQLELNRNNQLLIASTVATLTSDKFREKILIQALKSNEATLPSSGILAFSLKTNHLICFITVNPTLINHDKIFSLLPPFIEKAKLWKEKIQVGEIPVIEQVSSTSSKSGLFGLTN